NIQMLASGGNDSYIWKLQSGTLPTGLSISSSGRIAGRPMVTGTFTFVLSVTDGVLIGSKQYSVQVNPANTHLFVNASAAGANNGSSWADGFTDMQAAIAQSGAGDEIWTAKGIYSPG